MLEAAEGGQRFDDAKGHAGPQRQPIVEIVAVVAGFAIGAARGVAAVVKTAVEARRQGEEGIGPETQPAGTLGLGQQAAGLAHEGFLFVDARVVRQRQLDGLLDAELVLGMQGRAVQHREAQRDSNEDADIHGMRLFL